MHEKFFLMHFTASAFKKYRYLKMDVLVHHEAQTLMLEAECLPSGYKQHTYAPLSHTFQAHLVSITISWTYTRHICVPMTDHPTQANIHVLGLHRLGLPIGGVANNLPIFILVFHINRAC